MLPRGLFGIRCDSRLEGVKVVHDYRKSPCVDETSLWYLADFKPATGWSEVGFDTYLLKLREFARSSPPPTLTMICHDHLSRITHRSSITAQGTPHHHLSPVTCRSSRTTHRSQYTHTHTTWALSDASSTPFCLFSRSQVVLSSSVDTRYATATAS